MTSRRLAQEITFPLSYFPFLKLDSFLDRAETLHELTADHEYSQRANTQYDPWT
jgi:hypothetical protein